MTRRRQDWLVISSQDDPTTVLSRRDTLQWMLAAAGVSIVPHGLAVAEQAGAIWPELKLPPIDAPGYGTAPDLVNPVTPWKLTLNAQERATIRVLAELIIPSDEHSDGAGHVQVDAFIDEWVSAPYPVQQADREMIIPGLKWIDEEAKRRFGKRFTALDSENQKLILNDIAFRDAVKPGMEKPAGFFAQLRNLVLIGYYTSPTGESDLGYIGNQALPGPYPGPNDEALEHLHTILAQLNLPLPGEGNIK